MDHDISAAPHGPLGAPPAELPPSRAIQFQIAREAVRHMIAVRMSELWSAQRRTASDAGTAALRAEVQELSVQLRELPASDPTALHEVITRCSQALKARAPGLDVKVYLRPEWAMLSAQERLRLFDEFIWPALCSSRVAHGDARAVVFGSHVGCGKARAIAEAARALGGPEQVVAVMLEDLRAYHPRYAVLLQHSPRLAMQYTNGDVMHWVELALQRAVAMRVPLILEAGMRQAETIVDVFGFLEGSGYEVEARALAVPHAISWQNIVVAQELSRRELGLTRTITAAAHQATFDGLPVMLAHIEYEHLATVVTVYDRFGTCCYRHDVRTGDKAGSATSAETALRIHRALPMTLNQMRRFHVAYRWLEQCVAAPAPGRDYEELLQTEALRWDAECALLSEAFLTLEEEACVREFPCLRSAFEILARIRQQSESLADPLERALWVKKAATIIARRIADGNLTLPLPW